MRGLGESVRIYVWLVMTSQVRAGGSIVTVDGKELTAQRLFLENILRRSQLTERRVMLPVVLIGIRRFWDGQGSKVNYVVGRRCLYVTE